MSDKLKPNPKRSYPYAERYGALHAIPAAAVDRDEVLR